MRGQTLSLPQLANTRLPLSGTKLTPAKKDTNVNMKEDTVEKRLPLTTSSCASEKEFSSDSRLMNAVSGMDGSTKQLLLLRN
jgi:hypothetical protein